MPELFHETELLCAVLSRRVAAGATAPVEFGPLFARVDWDRFLWLGQQHRVLVAWQHALLPPETALVPPEFLAQLQALAEVNQLQVLARARECCRLQDLFAQHQLDPINLSGWALGQRHHASPLHREIEPATTFCVGRADQPRVESLLASAGYPRFSPLRLGQRHRSDVFLLPPFVAGGERGDSDYQAAAARSETWTFSGRSLRLLHPHDWLLRLCASGLDHLWQPLHRALDLAELRRSQPALHWAAVWQRAQELGVERALLLGVATTSRQLEQPLPPLLPARLAEFPELRDCATLLAERLRSGCVEALSESEARRIRHAAGAAEPKTDSSLDSANRELADLGRYSPTPEDVAAQMLSLAEVGPNDVVYDLGCGDGRLVLAAAQRCGARAVGIDIDPARIAEAQARATSAGLSAERVRFVCGDLRAAPLADATVVCLYLQDFAYDALRAKIARELRPGTRIVSHRFSFAGWPPQQSRLLRTAPDRISPVHLWRVGAEVSVAPAQ